MSSNNIAVKITADVVDLQTKFAVAKAEVNALTGEMNKLAKASAAGVIDSAGQARLQQVSSDLLRAKTNAQGLAGQLAEAGIGMGTLGRNAEGAHTGLSGVLRETRALFDELSSGRTKQSPGTVALLATRLYSLAPAAFGAVAGVAALAGGLGYLAYRAISASNAIDQIKIGADFAGNLSITRQQIQQFTDEMSRAKNISSSEAREIAGSFASMHDITSAQFHALTAVVSDFAQVTGQEAPKAAEELAKMFGAKTSAAEFVRELGGATQQQINMAQAADRSGESNVVFAAKLDALTGALNRAHPAIEQHNAGIFASFKNFLTYSGAVQVGSTIEQTQTEIIASQNKERQKQVELLRQAAQANFAAKPPAEQTLKVGVAAAEAENPISQQVEQARAKITEMNAALAIAQQRGDQIDISKLNAGLQKAKENLAALQFGPVLDRMRTQMEQLAATWDGTQSGLLAKQIQIAQQALSQAQVGSKQYLDIKSEEARLEVQLKRTAGEEVLANARVQIAALGAEENLQTLDRLAKEREVWAQLLAGERLTAAQRVEVQRSLSAATSAYTKEEAHEAEDLYSSWTEEFARINNFHTQILKEGEAVTARAAKQESQAWRGAVQEIEGAEGQLVSNILGGRRSLTQSLIQLSGELVTREIANDLRAMTTRLLMGRSFETAQKALEQGGFLYHLLFDQRKTATAVAGEAARTSAATSGAAARTAATTAAAATAQATSAATGPPLVMADAAKAAAGTFASVAQIPYVGWALAPEAAAGAFAAVSAYAPLAAFDIGTNYVPHDMVAQIHEGEAIVPKAYNPAAGGEAGSGRGGDTHHNYYGSMNIHPRSDLATQLRTQRGQNQLVGALAKAYRRGARH